jgi:hypothetical protein
LYELFLGDQTSFVGQSAIDPCIDWGESSNENIRANCAADGIPADFTGGASSATIVSGGGAGVLEPETSEATTAGFVFTPTFVNASLAIDYFEIEVEDQIAQLSGGAILGGCYGAPVYPNAFCELFNRSPADAASNALAVDTVQASYLNVDLQTTQGIDATVRYDRDFSFGSLVFESNATWVFEDIQRLFDPSLASGFETPGAPTTCVGHPTRTMPPMKSRTLVSRTLSVMWWRIVASSTRSQCSTIKPTGLCWSASTTCLMLNHPECPAARAPAAEATSRSRPPSTHCVVGQALRGSTIASKR